MKINMPMQCHQDLCNTNGLAARGRSSAPFVPALVCRWLLVGCLIFIALPVWVGASESRPVTGSWVGPDKAAIVQEQRGQERAAPAQFTVRGGAENLFTLEFYSGQWEGWETVRWKFNSETEFPPGTRVYFFTKDWDFLWRQVYFSRASTEGCEELVFELPLRGERAAERWQPTPHHRPWHELTAGQVIEAGFCVVLPEGHPEFEGKMELVEWQLLTPAESATPPQFRDLKLLPSHPQVGSMVEARLSVSAAYDNPFDREQVAVDAEVLRPDGRRETVAGFYYEGFLAEPNRPREILIPYGPPEFRLRYTPRIEGEHQVRLTVQTPGGKIEAPVFSFHAGPADKEYQGFIRIDPEKPLHLAHDHSGRIFDGIGLNIRTPDDLRYLSMRPASIWRDEGLEVYRRMFPRLAAAGVNVVEVWMSSWWLALEWINDAPGFHGVGYFNPYRAWKLDQLLRLAEEHGIYIILVLNNHGKFSTFCDREWERNPYNVANGGYLNSPDLYFSEERARRDFKRTADYIVARWGYSPNILMWKLFSEIDLTGTSSRVYQQPPMREWHREMSEYLKEIDPYDHLVSTHWSSNYTRINDPISRLPAIDVPTTDAYSGAPAQVLQFFEATMHYARQIGKPTIITEYGGPPGGDSAGVLSRQLRVGLWEGYFLESAITPMLWWFGFVDEHDLYDEFAALAAFVRGEDRRHLVSSSQQIAQNNLRVRILASANRALAWGYDQTYYASAQENLVPRTIDGVSLELEGMNRGEYSLEIWGGGRARPTMVKELSLSENDSKITVEVPPFQRDFALKIIRRDTARRTGGGTE